MTFRTRRNVILSALGLFTLTSVAVILHGLTLINGTPGPEFLRVDETELIPQAASLPVPVKNVPAFSNVLFVRAGSETGETRVPLESMVRMPSDDPSEGVNPIAVSTGEDADDSGTLLSVNNNVVPLSPFAIAAHELPVTEARIMNDPEDSAPFLADLPRATGGTYSDATFADAAGAPGIAPSAGSAGGAAGGSLMAGAGSPQNFGSSVSISNPAAANVPATAATQASAYAGPDYVSVASQSAPAGSYEVSPRARGASVSSSDSGIMSALETLPVNNAATSHLSSLNVAGQQMNVLNALSAIRSASSVANGQPVSASTAVSSSSGVASPSLPTTPDVPAGSPALVSSTVPGSVDTEALLAPVATPEPSSAALILGAFAFASLIGRLKQKNTKVL